MHKGNISYGMLPLIGIILLVILFGSALTSGLVPSHTPVTTGTIVTPAFPDPYSTKNSLQLYSFGIAGAKPSPTPTTSALFPTPTTAPTPTSVVAAASICKTDSWTKDPNRLPQPLSTHSHSSIAVNGYVYVLNGTTHSVFYSKLNSDGSLGNWQTSPNFIPASSRQFHASVFANGYIYITGGTDIAGIQTASVIYSKLNSDGSNDPWTESPNPMPKAVSRHTAVVVNGFIYVIGGYLGPGSASNVVYYSKLNSDGSLGNWQTSPNLLPQVGYSGGGATANGYIYNLSGGGNGSPLATLYYTKINSDGSIGPWQTSSSQFSKFAALFGDSQMPIFNGFIYKPAIESIYSNKSYLWYAKVNTDGTVGEVKIRIPTLYNANFRTAIAANNHFYLIGASGYGLAIEEASSVYCLKLE